MKTIKVFVSASIKNVVVGIIGSLGILLFIWKDDTPNIIYPMIAFSFLNIFVCVVFDLVFLFPLSYFEKERINTNTLLDSFKLYLPGVTFIPGILFFLLFFNFPNDEPATNEYYCVLLAPVVLLCQTAAGLWTFLKEFKIQLYDSYKKNQLVDGF